MRTGYLDSSMIFKPNLINYFFCEAIASVNFH